MKVLKFFVFTLLLGVFSSSIQSCKDEAPCIDPILGTYTTTSVSIPTSWDIEIKRGEGDDEAIFVLTEALVPSPDYIGTLNDNCSVMSIPFYPAEGFYPQLNSGILVFIENTMTGILYFETETITFTAEK